MIGGGGKRRWKISQIQMANYSQQPITYATMQSHEARNTLDVILLLLLLLLLYHRQSCLMYKDIFSGECSKMYRISIYSFAEKINLIVNVFICLKSLALDLNKN